MSTREKFEDFARKLSMPLQRDSDGYGLLDGYGWRETNCAWLCWQASHAAALQAALLEKLRGEPFGWLYESPGGDWAPRFSYDKCVRFIEDTTIETPLYTLPEDTE